MDSPRLRHLPSKALQEMTRLTSQQGGVGFAVDPPLPDNDELSDLRKRYGDDWMVVLPTINPYVIQQELRFSAMAAAGWCRIACGMLSRGHRQRVKQYLVLAYAIALAVKSNEYQISMLADYVVDGRTKSTIAIDKVSADVLHYLFIYVFFQSGMTTRNRATQYAQALQPYFDSNTEPSVVERHLKQHGPDRLRRAAMRQAALLQGAEEWAKLHGDPATATIDNVLDQLGPIECDEEGINSFDAGHPAPDALLPQETVDNEAPDAAGTGSTESHHGGPLEHDQSDKEGAVNSYGEQNRRCANSIICRVDRHDGSSYRAAIRKLLETLPILKELKRSLSDKRAKNHDLDKATQQAEKIYEQLVILHRMLAEQLRIQG